MSEVILKETLEKINLQIDVTSTSPTTEKQVAPIESTTPNT